MQRKREERNYLQVIGISTIILFIMMIIIPIAFFYLLSSSVPEESFGMSEIVFSLIFGILTTSFLFWTKSISNSNPYLGTIIGVLALVSLEYALFIRYSGGYTITFAIISGIVVLIYLGMNFFAGLKLHAIDDEDIVDE